MKVLLVVAAASLLAPAAPALAQSSNTSGLTSGYHERLRPHARRHVHADRSAQSRYGSSDVYVREGRASAPEVFVPGFAWRPETQEEGVGADLIGPGSSAENPTDEHDVSR